MYGTQLGILSVGLSPYGVNASIHAKRRSPKFRLSLSTSIVGSTNCCNHLRSGRLCLVCVIWRRFGVAIGGFCKVFGFVEKGFKYVFSSLGFPSDCFVSKLFSVPIMCLFFGEWKWCFFSGWENSLSSFGDFVEYDKSMMVWNWSFRKKIWNYCNWKWLGLQKICGWKLGRKFNEINASASAKNSELTSF